MNNVLTEILASPIPSVARPFILALCTGEGGISANAWLTCYGGAVLDVPLTSIFNAKNTLWAGKQGPQGISHALGSGQFQPATYEEAAARTGLPDLQPQSQLANTWNHAQFVYHHVTSLQLLDTLTAGKWEDAADVLKGTWASFLSSKLPVRYAAAVQMLAAVPPVTPPSPPQPPSAPPPPIVVDPSVDPELKAIVDLLHDLAPLDAEGRQRVIAYVEARLNIVP